MDVNNYCGYTKFDCRLDNIRFIVHTQNHVKMVASSNTLTKY
jgi:hypothetical protein